MPTKTQKRKPTSRVVRSRPLVSIPKQVRLASSSYRAPNRLYNQATSKDVESFRCALADPFCESASGSRVPDDFHFPTEALTVRCRINWLPTVTTGGEYLLLAPHPTIGAMQLYPFAANPTSISPISGVAFSVPANTNAASKLTYNAVAPTSYSALQAVSQSFRVVGWGARVRNVTNAQNVQGDLLIGVLPTTGAAPSTILGQWGFNVAKIGDGVWEELATWASLPTRTYTTANAINGSGVPILTNIETLPSFEVYSGAELAQTGGVVVRPKVHSPGAAYTFRPSKTDVNAQYQCGYGSVLTAAGVGGTQTGTGFYNPRILDTSGHNCIVITNSQSTVQQVYEIELVYHLETIPLISSSSLGTTASASPVGAAGIVDKVVNNVLKLPWIEFIKREGRSMLSSMEQALPGLMTRAAMLALT